MCASTVLRHLSVFRSQNESWPALVQKHSTHALRKLTRTARRVGLSARVGGKYSFRRLSKKNPQSSSRPSTKKKIHVLFGPRGLTHGQVMGAVAPASVSRGAQFKAAEFLRDEPHERSLASVRPKLSTLGSVFNSSRAERGATAQLASGPSVVRSRQHIDKPRVS
eukprot:6193331-Pleurochrysis_carterae.AAC.2